MGAKQSKRSVDISGKEGEGGGEVAAAGAGGEGRVEQLADSDALKPQLNGDAHIQHEQTDKEKELDSGTPENEKDATTEKEAKEEDDKDKEAAPVTNGETEQKVENGESAQTPEDGKKPKKEKVKKKWSLRSISFSRKDKPKQEKKQKEEEPKTNGEPEKVPEETAAEASPEPTTNEVVEEAKAPVEEKDEKTPETPVTEPLTNGSSTPDSVKAETLPGEEPSPPAPAEPVPEAKSEPEPAPAPAPAPEPVTEPEQLPVNGLSLEETKPETPAIEKPAEIKAEQPVTETVEITPAPEIPKEVCVERMPLLEPTPPPLPANPPPSSVASFAASTMAPEPAPHAAPPLAAQADTKLILDAQLETQTRQIDEPSEIDLPAPLKETSEEASAAVIIDEPVIEDKVSVAQEAPTNGTDVPTAVDDADKIDIETVKMETSEPNIEIIGVEPTSAPEPVQNVAPKVDLVENGHIENEQAAIPNVEEVEKEPAKIEPINHESHVVDSDKIEIGEEKSKTSEVEHATVETPEVPAITEDVSTNVTDGVQDKTESLPVAVENGVSDSTPSVPETLPEIEPADIPEPVDIPEPEEIPEPEVYNHEVSEDSSLPPPPMEEDDDAPTSLEADDKVEESLKQIPEPIADMNGTGDMTNGVHELSPGAPRGNKAIPAPAALAHHTAQEPISVSDKLADLIPEVPDVPEIKTETEQVLDVAVAN